MRDRLFSLLGIESGEEYMVSILLTQSVFLGIFFGSFDISAHSLFLSIFDEKMMAKGYVISGVAGIILTSLYTWFQTRTKFRIFAIVNLLVVTLLTLILWLGLLLIPSKVVIFFVFIMLGPLNILAMLGFWGTTGRLFTLRQGKRLFGLVDAGLIIGIIISCYTIPILLSFNFESHNILFVSASSVLIATIFQILIGSRFRPGATGQPEKQEEKKSVLKVFREDPYTRTMAIFIALSVVTAFFVQYSFMAVTREQYTPEEDMARFLGIFTGSMMIFTLLVKLLVFSYLIRNYGLRTCLTISPVLVAFFTAVAVIIGMTMGYTPESTSGFLIFFLLLALSRLFSKSLKDSIESPSFKVIYQTIDEKVRYEVQSGMDGTVNEIAALSSGLILAGMGILSFVKLIHFSWVLFFIILIWIFAAFRLYTEYRKSIRKALNAIISESTESVSGEQKTFKNRFHIERTFKNDYFNLITGNYSPGGNGTYLKKIIEHAVAENDINLIPVLKKIASDTSLDEKSRTMSAEIMNNIGKLSVSAKDKDEKEFRARKMLSETRLPQTTEILRLLRDNAIESKRLAILTIGKFRLTDMLPEVCDCLNVSGLEADAYSVIRAFGRNADKDLQGFYLASSGNIPTSKSIMRLLGEINNKESIGFLFSRLWSGSRQLKEVALGCLINCGFKASDEDKDRLNQYISDIVSILTWNLAARVCLVRSNDSVLLSEIENEISRWRRFLFNLLSITYDSGSINKIRENLESDSVEGVNFALEMIDLVIDESVKPKIISLLDSVPGEEKVKNLFHFFPGEIPQYEKLLEDLLNRDYNLISIWTKACTLRRLDSIESANMTESVVALLFSPEEILREEAANLISRSNRELYRTASHRISEVSREKLGKIIYGEAEERDLLFEKNKFLLSCFEEISGEELLAFAGSLKLIRDFNEEEHSMTKDCIIWSVPAGGNGSETHIHYSQYPDPTGAFLRKSDTYFYLLPMLIVEEYLYQFPERSSEILKFIDKNEV